MRVQMVLAAVMLAVGPALSAGAAQVEIVPPPSRDVTPPEITPGPKGEGPLVREPAPPRPPEPARWQRFFLPVTVDAATFQVEKRTIHIAGVEPPPLAAVCPAGAEKWPCGRTALYSLRMFLHGRAVECYFPNAEGVTDITAPCRVGNADIGLWLLGQGWARPSDIATGDYEKAATEAVCAQRGIWRGTKPDADCPKPSAN
jgi:endonuclease YncB( thermonuclease family)